MHQNEIALIIKYRGNMTLNLDSNARRYNSQSLKSYTPPPPMFQHGFSGIIAILWALSEVMCNLLYFLYISIVTYKYMSQSFEIMLFSAFLLCVTILVLVPM